MRPRKRCHSVARRRRHPLQPSGGMVHCGGEQVLTWEGVSCSRLNTVDVIITALHAGVAYYSTSCPRWRVKTKIARVFIVCTVQYYIISTVRYSANTINPFEFLTVLVRDAIGRCTTHRPDRPHRERRGVVSPPQTPTNTRTQPSTGPWQLHPLSTCGPAALRPMFHPRGGPRPPVAMRGGPLAREIWRRGSGGGCVCRAVAIAHPPTRHHPSPEPPPPSSPPPPPRLIASASPPAFPLFGFSPSLVPAD